MRVSAIALGALVAASNAAPPASESPSFETLTIRWPGPYGGLPPVDVATPAAMESAYLQAIERKREEVREIATNTASPTFDNTVAALEASGRALARIEDLFQIFVTTASSDAIRDVASRVMPKSASLADEIAHDGKLFARVHAVFQGLPGSAPTPEARRLVAVWHERMIRRGASLSADRKRRLEQINARLAALTTQFSQNVAREEESLVVFVDDEAELAGLGEEWRRTAKAAAQSRGRPGSWAIPVQRPSVWPVLTKADSRALRERVFIPWSTRGDHRGPYDNAPVMTEILKLRGEKARLLGYPTYAHFATAGRMAGTPEVASAMLERAWHLLQRKTEAEIAELQALANTDAAHAPASAGEPAGHTAAAAPAAGAAKFTIQPWDRLYYAEKLRQRKFSLDADAVKPYLALDNVMNGMMWAAGRVYGLSFNELKGIPVVSQDIRVFEVSRGGRTLGVLYVDMFQRSGKGPSSWASEYRTAGRGPAEVLPVVALHSNVVHPADGGQPLLSWEVANVIFHEFGHTLHTLSNGARYPSLGSVEVPWDFVEVPSLLNERWLLDRELLTRFAKHWQTGRPMPEELIAKVEQGVRHDRVFSVTLDYLATAIVDMRLHLMADGRSIDAVREEARILAEIGMPSAVAPTLRASHAFHTFSEQYAAGVYTYLWSDAIAADIAEAFLAAPGRLYDLDVAGRYRRTILEAGNTRPMTEAFREFRGRDPDPDALFRRFGLLQ